MAVDVFKEPIAAHDIKQKARALGADLVGIADGNDLNENPPDPQNPRRPADITDCYVLLYSAFCI